MSSATNKYKDVIVPIILKHLPEATIILYGSRARQTDRMGSDIDVALDAGSRIPDIIMSNIEEDLENSLLPINFDVVDIHAVNEEFRNVILKEGVVWHKLIKK